MVKNCHGYIIFGLIISSLFANNCLKAQSDDDSIFTDKKINYLEFTLNPTYPVYTFKEKLGKNLFGISLAYLRQRKLDRLDYFGFQFSYAQIGSINQLFPQFEDTTVTNMMSFHLMYRYFPDFYFWRIEPFLKQE
jgi:hypothetical protein